MTEQMDTIEPVESQEKEMTFINKMTGILFEPITTFKKIAKFPVKAMDWLTPIIILLFIASISQVIYLNTPAIKEQMTQMEVSLTEEIFTTMVENGQMSQDVADQELDKAYQKAENPNVITKIFGMVFWVFLTFFIISSLFFLIARFVFGDKGNYSSSLTAFGMAYYIAAIQAALLIIVSLITSRAIIGTSLTALLDYDIFTWKGFLLGRINIFTIWFYAVVSIGYAKMFKSTNIAKYIITIFVLWFGFSALIFWVANSVVFLKGFAFMLY